MKFAIKRATPEDLEEILRLFYETVKAINSNHYSQEQIEAWLDDSKRERRFAKKIEEQLFYACKNEKDEIVGFSSITEDGYLDLLYASMRHQREGIGTLLLEQMLVAAKIHRFEKIEADVSISAVPFFESHGFLVVKKQEVERNGVKLTNYKMRKTYVVEEYKPETKY